MKPNRTARRAAVRSQSKRPTQSIMRRVPLWLKANKKRAIAIGIGGAILLASARYYKDVPYWTGHKKPYRLGILISPHSSRRDVVNVETALTAAKAKGKPYHLMLVEASGLNKSNVVSRISEWNNRASQMRFDYQNLARDGMSVEEATSRLRNHYGKVMGKGYALDICLLLAREGVRIAPAESYDTKTVQRLEEIDKEVDRKNLILQQLANTNAPLAQLQPKFRDVTQLYRQLAQIREKTTSANIRDIIAQSKELFPELKKEREVRVLAQFGTYHGDELRPERFKSNALEAFEVPAQKSYSLVVYAAQNRNKVANYGEFESRLESLAAYLDEPLRAIAFGDTAKGIPSNLLLAEKVFQNAVKTTQEEFMGLSEKTKDLNFQQRITFLLNYFSKKSQ